MKKLIHYFETDHGKFVKNAIVCGGASVVLLGALFKLMHWPGATFMLIAGMGTEVILFAFFAILPPHADYYWEKYYPGLNVNPDLEGHGEGGEIHGSAIEQIDAGLKEAEVGQEVIDRLGNNLKKLGDHMGKLSDLSDASVASSNFANNANAAADSLAGLQGAYAEASNAAGALTQASEGAAAYRDQMNEVANRMASLNELYQGQIDSAASVGKFFDSLNQVAGNLEGAAADTARYKEEVADLVRQISSLNSVYGNMLSAMNTAQ